MPDVVGDCKENIFQTRWAAELTAVVTADIRPVQGQVGPNPSIEMGVEHAIHPSYRAIANCWLLEKEETIFFKPLEVNHAPVKDHIYKNI